MTKRQVKGWVVIASGKPRGWLTRLNAVRDAAQKRFEGKTVRGPFPALLVWTEPTKPKMK